MRDFRDNKAGKFEFRYRKSDPGKVKERANQSGGKFDQLFKDAIPTFSPKAGKDYKIRIMPPGWENAESYNFELWVHYGVGADNQRYACLQKMKDEPCPICEEVNRMQRAGDEELANKLKAKKRQVPYIVDRDRQSEGPMIWPAPWTTDRDIAALCISKRTGAIIYVDDPDSGRDIEFDYVKKGDFPEMIGLKVDGQDSPLSDDPKEQRRWLKFITENPIPEAVIYYEYDHIKKVLDGGKVKEDSDDDEADEKPRGITRSERQARDAKRTPADRERLEKDRKRHLEDNSVDLDKDEIDDEDDSLDNLDEPKRKTVKRRSLDDDEEADARPKRNGKRRDVEDESDIPPRRSKASRDDESDEDEAESVSRRKASQRLSRDDIDDEESVEDDEPVRRRR